MYCGRAAPYPAAEPRCFFLHRSAIPAALSAEKRGGAKNISSPASRGVISEQLITPPENSTGALPCIAISPSRSPASESATAKGGDATFSLSAASASCADEHTGEIVEISGLTVDISRWEAAKTITIQYSIRFRCTDPDCELYSADNSFLYDGKHTFANVDAELCHKPFSGSFTDTFDAAYGTTSKKFFNSICLSW